MLSVAWSLHVLFLPAACARPLMSADENVSCFALPQLELDLHERPFTEGTLLEGALATWDTCRKRREKKRARAFLEV